MKQKCKYVGPHVTSKLESSCTIARESNGHRKTCCSFTRYCYGRRCHDTRKKCKIGKLVTYQHGKSCFFEKVIKTWKRKVCCAFIRKCLDRKCSIVRRVCKVTSSRRRTKLGRRKLELRRRREEARLERKQKRSKHSCDCYKQELQNYRVLQAKRNRISKKYQKGRQHLENLREQLIINSSKSKKLRREIKNIR